MGARADGVGIDGAQQLVVDGWVLDRRLGAGSYGEVWRARRRHLDLVRALKLVAVGDDDAFDNWRQEISRLEELSHPNVVRFYDADIVADGRYQGYAWIATELCEHSLATELRNRPDGVLADAEAERLVEQMLGALSAARSRECVHRDVKPGNILLHASGVWKLCDFGTARLLPADGTHPLTQVIGTSPYMSAAAMRGQQNHAADLYALAVTVHEALCGRLLHPRSPDMSEVDYAGAVLNTPPTVSPTLPQRWQTVVAALIGRYGPLDAATLTGWFAETRGTRPPPQVTLPTEAAVHRPNGATAATSATLAAMPRPAAPQKYYVPAPAEVPPGPPPAPVPPRSPVRPPPAPDPAVDVVRKWVSERATTLDPSGIVRRRAVAFLIDLVLLSVVCIGGYQSVVRSDFQEMPPGTPKSCQDLDDQFADCVTFPWDDTVYVSDTHSVASDLAIFMPLFLVLVVMQGITGLTPGKLARGLRVVGPDWRRPGMRRAFLRSALWVVDGLPCVFPGVGALMLLTRKDRRRLGDLAADTYVIPRDALKAHKAAAKQR